MNMQESIQSSQVSSTSHVPQAHLLQACVPAHIVTTVLNLETIVLTFSFMV